MGCNKHTDVQGKGDDKKIVKQTEEDSAAIEEIDEAEKGFWTR